MQIGAGDLVTVSVSHQVKVGRDESWAKQELAYQVKIQDDPKTIEQEVRSHVLTEVMKTVDETVEQVRENS